MSADEAALETYMLAAMRLAAQADPAPGRLAADAMAALAMRLPGCVVATPADLTAASGARAGGKPQMHRFAAGDTTLDVETTITEGRLEIAGQVSPPPVPSAYVEVRTPHLTKVRVPSADGQFAVAGLPPGWVSVAYHRPSDAPVVTRWLRVRA
ncbi:hypothetical protein [Herbidospora cretacea]|uniref:hypothetical protein n=1 Tax=Herbidospora cretacea TaxID=28444 RepID=UPI000AD7CAF1|nr:hypothetical protein [Herbidospora cretacea]